MRISGKFNLAGLGYFLCYKFCMKSKGYSDWVLFKLSGDIYTDFFGVCVLLFFCWEGFISVNF